MITKKLSHITLMYRGERKLFTDKKTLGEFIRDRRMTSKITVATLGKKIFLDPIKIHNIENGSGYFHYDALKRILAYLNLPLIVGSNIISSPSNHFGDLIVSRQKETGCNARCLANLLNLSYSTVYRSKKGDCSIRWNKLACIFSVLSITASSDGGYCSDGSTESIILTDPSVIIIDNIVEYDIGISDQSFGKAIRKIRENRKISIREFSVLLGVHYDGISRMENGKHSISYVKFKKVMDTLGLKYHIS